MGTYVFRVAICEIIELLQEQAFGAKANFNKLKLIQRLPGYPTKRLKIDSLNHACIQIGIAGYNYYINTVI